MLSFFADTTERGDREWKQAQRQGDFLDNSSTQKTKGGPKLVLSPKAVTALRPLKDDHRRRRRPPQQDKTTDIIMLAIHPYKDYLQT